MQIEKMEDVAQGRVWTGKAALERGLVDAIGGMPRAVAIAKQKAGIADEQQVRALVLQMLQINTVEGLSSSTNMHLLEMLNNPWFMRLSPGHNGNHHVILPVH